MRTLGDFRSLPKEDQWRLLRWGPMAVADLVAESIDTELLRATVAADGIFGAMLGPWSAGSGLQLLLSSANRALAWPAGRLVRGGPGCARARARGRGHRGSASRSARDARSTRINVDDDRAAGVTLERRRADRARAVVSGVDPKRTFLKLCEADHLPPEFLWRMKHYRSRGTLAKVNLALSALAVIRRRHARDAGGRVRLAPDLDYLERAFDHAKYGRFSTAPWIEFTMPSIGDPRSRRQARTCCRHMCSSRRISSGIGDRDRGSVLVGGPARSARRHRRKTLTQYAPDFGVADRRAADDHAARPRARMGPHRRPHLPRRAVARPVLHDAAAAGFWPVSDAAEGLFLCGSGSHPGTGLTGGSGMNAAREVLRSF